MILRCMPPYKCQEKDKLTIFVFFCGCSQILSLLVQSEAEFHVRHRSSVYALADLLTALQESSAEEPEILWEKFPGLISKMTWSQILPRKPTWNLKMDPWKERFLLKTIIFRFHASFGGCTSAFFNAFYMFCFMLTWFCNDASWSCCKSFGCFKKIVLKVRSRLGVDKICGAATKTSLLCRHCQFSTNSLWCDD